MHIGYISQVDIIKNDCKCNGNAMHWKVRFFKIPFRKEVFIFVKAAYECLSPEEGLAAPQPVITSNRLFFLFSFFSGYFCRDAKAEHVVQMPFSAIYKRIKIM